MQSIATPTDAVCDCGDTIHVIWSSQSSSLSAFRMGTSDTVDYLGYGYDGGSAISYSTSTNLFTFASAGIYSASAKLRRLTGGLSGEANLFFLREDRTDNILSLHEANETRSVANRAPGGWAIQLSVPGYPVPAGSTWGLWVVQSPSIAFEVGAEAIITKINCCDLPPGPPQGC